MKQYILLLFFVVLINQLSYSQNKLSGTLISKTEQYALAGASVQLKRGKEVVLTNEKGYFEFNKTVEMDTLQISYVGYITELIPVSLTTISPLRIELQVVDSKLQEVVINTGYYEVPKERATGSFTHINNELFNRTVGGNVLQRLEGVASGVQFVNANGNSAKDIRIRGIATLESNETPLIVIDNFPYEGDINSINPDDIESVTILKDAAAASIWGARAGNGVIVITTKAGRYHQKANISFNSNATIGNKPNLFYNQKWLPSDAVMGIEKQLFDRGNYVRENKTPLPGYVSLLFKKENNEISEEEFARQEAIMKKTDIRKEATALLYQQSLNRQHTVNISGGGDAYTYYISTGMDQDRSYTVGNENKRLNLNLRNTFKPMKGLELTAAIWYSNQKSENNGLIFNDLKPKAGQRPAPYLRLIDENGNAMAIPYERSFDYYESAQGLGLLDWHYRPWDEVGLSNNWNKDTEYRLNGGLKYSFLNGFNLNATYQYRISNSHAENYYDPKSYYVRDLVNQFTQDNGKSIVPNNAILDGGARNEITSQAGRLQLNYNRLFNKKHRLNALMGGEIRDMVDDTFPGYRLYNFDKEVYTGTAMYNYSEIYKVKPDNISARLPAPNSSKRLYTDRYLSYFGNAGYTYQNRYTLSGSLRWDASNLFGVKTNQKGVPLWSIGGSWLLSDEAFYNQDWLPYLRLRATYGSSGNVNKNISVFPVVTYSTDNSTNLMTSRLRSVGNPSLRWEKVNTTNLGMDFGIQNKRINGSLEYYIKKASDLIGDDYMAPSTGINEANYTLKNKINYANITTKGLDAQIVSRNFIGKFSWNTDFLFSYTNNKVTHFNTAEKQNVIHFLETAPPVIGRSRDIVYAFPWYGLSPQNGYPQVLVNDVLTQDYKTFVDNFTPETVLIAGVKVAPYYGSVRNAFRFKQVELSANISWRAGHVFKRQSISPADEYYSPDNYHEDYLKRWKEPGDEKSTDVPAWAEVSLGDGSMIYKNSTALIAKGDQIRLQDVNLSYSLSKSTLQKLPIKSIRLYGYARNLGVLWRENKNGIDPDYVNTDFPSPKTFALGLQIDF